MLDRMAHRGPDGRGVWDDGRQACLGHVRLAVIDLSDAANQPFFSPDGRYVFVYNGEIYNYIELRPGLEAKGWTFRTSSDTEVLMAGLILEGPEFLHKTLGMFAFALWDDAEKTALIARDRIGIKPLYFAELSPGRLVIASELKSALLVDGVDRDIDPEALDAYLTFRFVPGPRTMVKGVRKFPPGAWGLWKNGRLTVKTYWEIAFNSSGDPGGHGDALEKFETILSDAVTLRMRSDVPFGAFLSGGVDSSSVVALMKRAANRPVNTFSIGFEQGPSELDASEKIARHFGAHHTSFILRSDDLLRLPEVAWYLDEPFPDPVALAMYLLAERAAGDVTVILTGEGADELLAGYVHHPHLRTLARWGARLPGPLLAALGTLAARAPMALIDSLFDYPASPGPKGRERIATLLRSAGEGVDRYISYVSLFPGAERRRLYTRAFSEMAGTSFPRSVAGPVLSSRGDPLDAVLMFEYRYWLADNILFKQDKLLMAHGVEGRVPFCDHRLVEFAAALPLPFKLAGRNKAILRDVAARLYPQDLLASKKQAFMVPLDGPYRDRLRAMLGDYLSESALKRRGIFDPAAVARLADSFDRSPFIVGKQLSALLMFELWARRVLDGEGA